MTGLIWRQSSALKLWALLKISMVYNFGIYWPRCFPTFFSSLSNFCLTLFGYHHLMSNLTIVFWFFCMFRIWLSNPAVNCYFMSEKQRGSNLVLLKFTTGQKPLDGWGQLCPNPVNYDFCLHAQCPQRVKFALGWNTKLPSKHYLRTRVLPLAFGKSCQYHRNQFIVRFFRGTYSVVMSAKLPLSSRRKPHIFSWKVIESVQLDV
jgi:hypothetical protein